MFSGDDSDASVVGVTVTGSFVVSSNSVVPSVVRSTMLYLVV